MARQPPRTRFAPHTLPGRDATKPGAGLQSAPTRAALPPKPEGKFPPPPAWPPQVQRRAAAVARAPARPLPARAVQQMQQADQKETKPPSDDDLKKIAKKAFKVEYPYGSANKLPHIHVYARGFHLKTSDGTRLNIIQNGTYYKAAGAEALEFAKKYSQALYDLLRAMIENPQ